MLRSNQILSIVSSMFAVFLFTDMVVIEEVAKRHDFCTQHKINNYPENLSCVTKNSKILNLVKEYYPKQRVANIHWKKVIDDCVRKYQEHKQYLARERERKEYEELRTILQQERDRREREYINKKKEEIKKIVLLFQNYIYNLYVVCSNFF